MSPALSPRTRFALLASLALNVVMLVALAIMHAPWREGRREGHGGRHGPSMQHLIDLRALKRSLKPERAVLLDEAMEAHRTTMRQRLGELFEARRAVRMAIIAEPYDRAAVDAAFAHLRAMDAATASEVQALLADVIDRATPEERRRLGELMERRGSRAHAERRRAVPDHGEPAQDNRDHHNRDHLDREPPPAPSGG